MPKRKFKFADALKGKFPHSKDTGKGNLLRNRFGSVLSITSGGRADINSHLGSK